MINQKQKNILILLTILSVGIYYALIKPSNNIQIEKATEEVDEIVEEKIVVEEVPTTIIVHITGAVKSEGIVELAEGDRIVDAIENAGGANENADLSEINLAYKLEDGLKIYIPTFEETAKLENIEPQNNYIQGVEVTNQGSTTGLVNINTATQTELESLPGVGPSTALKILNYIEENGKFTKIEDVKSVSGIGDSKYESMKDYITVN